MAPIEEQRKGDLMQLEPMLQSYNQHILGKAHAYCKANCTDPAWKPQVHTAQNLLQNGLLGGG